ncbi:MAG TPA: DUF2326 domain-containing protein [Solirubrobacterales bacterium]|nr:DUF2326 domain-containing protein [Solirubrobacterales bacterium]
MIHEITASHDSFKPVRFSEHFNVVLAERTAESSERDSRNGSGKSSLIEILHFCLGASLGATLNESALADWTFSTRLDLGETEATVSRNTSRPNRVRVDPVEEPWHLHRRVDEETGERYFGLDDWKEALSDIYFDLPRELLEETYTPSARTLLPYFARRGRDAFSDPFTFFRGQQSWSRQASAAVLLGLDWQIVRDAELFQLQEKRIREARKAIEAMRKAADPGGSDAEDLEGRLEAMKINLEREIREGARQLETFEVHPQYEELESEASDLTRQIHDLSGQNVSDRELLEFNQASLEADRPADPQAIEAMYAEAGIYFSDQLNDRLDAVKAFHDQIYSNRRAYLETELQRLQGVIAERERQIQSLSERRATLLGVLREHTALGEHVRLQELHNERSEQLGQITAELDQIRKFDRELANLRLRRDQNAIAAREDFQERRPQWSRAVDLFGANTAELYESPGELMISVADSGGLKLGYEIERGASQGVQEMMVFCYDLTLAELWAERNPSPGFLIHDSTIFDGVDERQIALGLALAERKSRECGFQYVCCLNSDAVPWDELPEGFDLREFVRLELSDEGEAGGLFGLRF